MNLEFAKITLPCPRCGENMTTRIADLRLWPVLTCAACGDDFTEDFGPLFGITDREHSNVRYVRLLTDNDLFRVPVLDVRLNEGH